MKEEKERYLEAITTLDFDRGMAISSYVTELEIKLKRYESVLKSATEALRE